MITFFIFYQFLFLPFKIITNNLYFLFADFNRTHTTFFEENSTYFTTVKNLSEIFDCSFYFSAHPPRADGLRIYANQH